MSERDGWCSPPWLTALLPEVDLDPCSNNRSTVRSRTTYSLERKQDGLKLPWFGDVYCNPPFSDILPWAQKAACELARPAGVDAIAFLVNVDSSTKWWAELTNTLDVVFLFKRRIAFVPPPGIKQSSNSKPQALIGNLRFFEKCEPGLFDHGRIYTALPRVVLTARAVA